MAAPKSIVSLDIGDDYQAQNDLRTLAQAEVIRADKKRYRTALALAKQQVQAIEAIDASVEDDDTGED